MTTFDDRESAFENKFAHDEEMKFKAEARRNKLLGLWAAALLGKEGDAANAYALEVVKSDFEEAGDEDVYRKVSGDIGRTLAQRMPPLTVGHDPTQSHRCASADVNRQSRLRGFGLESLACEAEKLATVLGHVLIPQRIQSSEDVVGPAPA